jgi:hypothetical protein
MGTVVLKFTTKGAPKKGPFSSLKMQSLGENDDNEFYALSDSDSRVLLTKLLSRYESFAVAAEAAVEALAPGEKAKAPPSWAALLDQIQDVQLYDSSDRYDPSLDAQTFEPTAVLDVVLWPTSILGTAQSLKQAKLRLDAVAELVALESSANQVIQLIDTDYRPDTLSLRILGDEKLLAILLKHPFVERIRGQLETPITPGDLVQAGNRSAPDKPLGAAIGVIDDLVVTANPWLKKVVVSHMSFPDGYVFGAASDHGAAVASIAAYGSFAEAVQGNPPPKPFPIYAVRIAEASSNGPRVVDNPVGQLESALQWLSACGVRIAVVSLGYGHADVEALPTELAVTVDRLSRELDMVVVVSAGNIREIDGKFHWRDSHPSYLKEVSSKVASPGTAAIAMTVGAIATAQTSSDPSLRGIASPGSPSPFTRVGPTRGNRYGKTQKPEFAAPGGNWGWRKDSILPVPSDPNLGIVTLSSANTPLFSVTTGTSVAAPYVAHEVAKVATRYPGASANLLRALTALSSPKLQANPYPGLQPAISSAYGVPNADRILESGGNRAILVFEGEIRTGTRTVHEIPIPAEFAKVAANADRELRVVLAFDPPVQRSRRNYVAGRMKFDFVRNMTFEAIKEVWEEQPTDEQRKLHPTLRKLKLPTGRSRPNMMPGISKASPNTLIRRDFVEDSWDEDDESYFLVVSHDSSPWTEPQLREYKTQDYAIAIELVDVGRTSLDVHSLTLLRQRELLIQSARGRVRT